jgi:hypothetical protein
MAAMKKTKQTPSDTRRSPQDIIDDRVVAQADDDSAWDPPVQISRNQKAAGLRAFTEARRELASKART